MGWSEDQNAELRKLVALQVKKDGKKDWMVFQKKILELDVKVELKVEWEAMAAKLAELTEAIAWKKAQEEAVEAAVDPTAVALLPPPPWPDFQVWPANEVRKTFVTFFEGKGHVNWISIQVVPHNVHHIEAYRFANQRT